jgi:hypothetical protein
MLSRLFPAVSASGLVTTGVEAAPGQQAAGATRYPPRDPSLPVQPLGAIAGAQPELMAMLRLHAAVESGVFNGRFGAPIAQVAGRVNVLPGSVSAEFAGSGGPFRAALETAVAFFRASDGRIFSGALGVEARHLLEPRWRYLCFVAGLLFPLGRPLRQMTVIGAAGEACPRASTAQIVRASLLATGATATRYGRRCGHVGPVGPSLALITTAQAPCMRRVRR